MTKFFTWFWATAEAAFGGLFRFMDTHSVSRRAALYVSLWITVDSYAWAKHFVDSHADKSGTDLGLTIGAVLAAVTAMQGWVFKLYLDGKTQDGKDLG